jgi:hypothetical protein
MMDYMASTTNKPTVPKLVTTKKAVKEYLEASQKKKFITNDGDECLIARFLNNQLPKSMRAQVDEKQIEIIKKNDESIVLKRMTTPEWMAKFIKAFDALHEEKQTVMTGKQISEAALI